LINFQQIIFGNINESVPVGVGLPTLLVSEMTVGGM